MLILILAISGFAVFLIAFALLIRFKTDLENFKEQKLKLYKEQTSLAWINIKPGTILSMQLFFAMGAFIVFSIILGSTFMGLLIGVAGFFAPSLYLNHKVKARREQFDMQMIEAMDVLSGSIKSGQTIAQAFQALVKHMPKPISEEVGIMLTSQRLGEPLGVALKRMADRMQSKNLDLIISSILIAEKTGGNLVETFQTMAESVREIYQLENKIKTSSAQERMQGNVLSIIPFALMIALFFINKPMILPLFTTLPGNIILATVILFEMIGIFFIRKLVHQEV